MEQVWDLGRGLGQEAQASIRDRLRAYDELGKQIEKLEQSGFRHEFLRRFKATARLFSVVYAWAEPSVEERVRSGEYNDTVPLLHQFAVDPRGLRALWVGVLHGLNGAAAAMVQFRFNIALKAATEGEFKSYFQKSLSRPFSSPASPEALFEVFAPTAEFNPWCRAVEKWGRRGFMYMDRDFPTEVSQLIGTEEERIRREYGYEAGDGVIQGRKDRVRRRSVEMESWLNDPKSIRSEQPILAPAELSTDDREPKAREFGNRLPEDPVELCDERRWVESLALEAGLKDRQIEALHALLRSGQQADAIGLTGDRSAVENAIRKLRMIPDLEERLREAAEG